MKKKNKLKSFDKNHNELQEKLLKRIAKRKRSASNKEKFWHSITI